MGRLMKLAATAGIMLAAATAPANAQVQKIIKCPVPGPKPAKPMLQTAIDAAPPGKTLRLVINNTCTETIRIPAGKSIILNGGGGAGKIRSTSASSSAVDNAGELRLEQIEVTTTAAAPSVITSRGNSTLEIVGSTISGDTAATVVRLSDSSTGRIVNSVISGGKEVAVATFAHAYGEIIGSADTPHFLPAVGNKTSISPSGAAIGCFRGGNILIRAQAADASAKGKVEIGTAASPAETGIWADMCTLSVNGADPGSIIVTSSGDAVRARMSTYALSGMTVRSSDGYGLSASQSRGSAEGVVFDASSGTSGDVSLTGGSDIRMLSGMPSSFPAFQDPSTTSLATYPSLRCVETSTIWFDPGSVTVPEGLEAEQLMNSDVGCLDSVY